MSKPTTKESADILRNQLAKIPDAQLIFFAHAVYSETFETLPERIERVALEHVESLPF